VRLGISALSQCSKVNNRDLDENLHPRSAKTFCVREDQVSRTKEKDLAIIAI